ncbi:type 4a pilus biogenesis protein PilO [Kushneria indalinina]|uniref:Type IV pilus assembly protein PilO n=1 Tax=Kushneria indalinina DSM 14324 TaxID=1122140 RepID=A0A3D9DUT5_9GAMM|nr:type 4a pilus biogenesis protein PilO [Kushneria indalinina]REC94124.1 type IV pilus assembly protein PilO [Kushneria indalinina DSM 14324]
MKPIDWRLEWQRLRQIRLSELSFEEGGSWPWLLRVLVCGVVVLIVAFGAQWFLAAPVAREVEEAHAQVETLKSQYATRAFQAANLPLLERRMQELDVRMGTLLSMLPTDSEVPALLDDISDAARGQQLEIDFIRLASPEAHPFYITQPLDIQVRGDYHRLAAFISQVAELPRIVTLHDFTLAPANGEAGEALVLSLQAETYRYEPEQNKVASAGAVTP